MTMTAPARVLGWLLVVHIMSLSQMGGQALSDASASRPRGLSLTMGDDEVTELPAALRPRLAESVARSARPVPAPPCCAAWNRWPRSSSGSTG
jgi:hypothetical protein